MSKISLEKFNNLVQSELPWAAENGMELRALEQGAAEMWMPYQARSIPPI